MADVVVTTTDLILWICVKISVTMLLVWICAATVNWPLPISVSFFSILTSVTEANI